MVCSFKQRFLLPIWARTKLHTIRAGDRWSVGMLVDGFIFGRQSAMLRVFRARASKVEPIVIEAGADLVEIDGLKLAADEREELARRDGFEDWATMRRFWLINHERGPAVFHGQVIHWPASSLLRAARFTKAGVLHWRCGLQRSKAKAIVAAMQACVDSGGTVDALKSMSVLSDSDARILAPISGGRPVWICPPSEMMGTYQAMLNNKGSFPTMSHLVQQADEIVTKWEGGLDVRFQRTFGDGD